MDPEGRVTDLVTVSSLFGRPRMPSANLVNFSEY